jgi:hypothetical protein
MIVDTAIDRGPIPPTAAIDKMKPVKTYRESEPRLLLLGAISNNKALNAVQKG